MSSFSVSLLEELFIEIDSLLLVDTFCGACTFGVYKGVYTVKREAVEPPLCNLGIIFIE
nr:MAG TPA: hypothetical protein [Bacteriophage sp.]